MARGRGCSARSRRLRAKSAIDAKDLDLAVQLLDAIVKIKPDYIEAWNRRATLHYMRKEYGQSMEDIRLVIDLYRSTKKGNAK